MQYPPLHILPMDTFKFSREWWVTIKPLPSEMQLKIVESLCLYAFEGKLPEDPIVSATVALMIKEIERDVKKAESIREKRSKAGRKGGAPKGNTNAKKQAETPHADKLK